MSVTAASVTPARLPATAEYGHHPHRDSDRRLIGAVSILGLRSERHPGMEPVAAYSPRTPVAADRKNFPAGSYLLSITAQNGATGMEVNTTLWYAIQ